MSKVVTSAKLAKLASKVLKGHEPTRDEIESLAACVLRQREKEEAEKKKAAEPVHVVPVTEAAATEQPLDETLTTLADLSAPQAEAAEEKRGFWSNLFGGRK